MNQFFSRNFYRIVRLAIAALLGNLFINVSCAQTPSPSADSTADANLKKTLEQRLGVPQVDAITKVPYAGLYEVRIGTDIIYTDANGDYLLVGNVIDLRSRENLTKGRVDALVEAATPKMKFSELPLSSAIKIVRGTGKAQLAIFADPNCGFCKRFEKNISELNDVTIYIFLYPILGADSVAKSKSIWCAPDRAKAWKDWMHAGIAPTAPGSCTNPIDKIVELGRKLRIDGTPMTLLSDGKRLSGALTLEEVQKALGK